MRDHIPRVLHVRRPVSNRFSMFERWQYEGSQSYVLGNNLRSLGRGNVELVVIDPRFDEGRCPEDKTKALSNKEDEKAFYIDEKSREPSLSDQSDTLNPFDDPCNISNTPQNHDSEQLYHVFARRQKWSMVVLIGVAGLFSGLSSNIYNPALNSIAQVHASEPPNCLTSISDIAHRTSMSVSVQST